MNDTSILLFAPKIFCSQVKYDNHFKIFFPWKLNESWRIIGFLQRSYKKPFSISENSVIFDLFTASFSTSTNICFELQELAVDVFSIFYNDNGLYNMNVFSMFFNNFSMFFNNFSMFFNNFSMFSMIFQCFSMIFQCFQ